ncbi:MAG: hypothetical protein C5B54_03080 [Acidobacteria bacterium]|nr:MAG: hypothetical protein C5B54_03080 [Acidobacteriota bacterium]
MRPCSALPCGFRNTVMFDHSTLLIAAAMPREISALKGRLPEYCSTIVTGVGAENAEKSLRGFLSNSLPAAVIAIGFAGALTAELKVGDIVVSKQVIDLKNEPITASLLQESVIAGSILSVHKMICTASEKQELASMLANHHPLCVDLESFAIAQVCRDYDVPFVIIKCITDLLDEDLPLDFNLYRTADGNLNSFAIASAAGVQPAVWKGLLELRHRTLICAERLAGFLEKTTFKHLLKYSH